MRPSKTRFSVGSLKGLLGSMGRFVAIRAAKSVPVRLVNRVARYPESSAVLTCDR